MISVVVSQITVEALHGDGVHTHRSVLHLLVDIEVGVVPSLEATVLIRTAVSHITSVGLLNNPAGVGTGGCLEVGVGNELVGHIRTGREAVLDGVVVHLGQLLGLSLHFLSGSGQAGEEVLLVHHLVAQGILVLTADLVVVDGHVALVVDGLVSLPCSHILLDGSLAVLNLLDGIEHTSLVAGCQTGHEGLEVLSHTLSKECALGQSGVVVHLALDVLEPLGVSVSAVAIVLQTEVVKQRPVTVESLVFLQTHLHGTVVCSEEQGIEVSVTIVEVSLSRLHIVRNIERVAVSVCDIRLIHALGGGNSTCEGILDIALHGVGAGDGIQLGVLLSVVQEIGIGGIRETCTIEGLHGQGIHPLRTAGELLVEVVGLLIELSVGVALEAWIRAAPTILLIIVEARVGDERCHLLRSVGLGGLLHILRVISLQLGISRLELGLGLGEVIIDSDILVNVHAVGSDGNHQRTQVLSGVIDAVLGEVLGIVVLVDKVPVYITFVRGEVPVEFVVGAVVLGTHELCALTVGLVGGIELAGAQTVYLISLVGDGEEGVCLTAKVHPHGTISIKKGVEPFLLRLHRVFQCDHSVNSSTVLIEVLCDAHLETVVSKAGTSAPVIGTKEEALGSAVIKIHGLAHLQGRLCGYRFHTWCNLSVNLRSCHKQCTRK